MDGERILRATFDHYTLYGIYLPQGLEKEPHLKYLIKEARQRRNEKMVCIGDFNTGSYKLDVEPNIGKVRKIFQSPSFPEFASAWTDAWRHMYPDGSEFSWYSTPKDPSKRRGFRIDNCFISAPLVSRVRTVSYDHRPRETTSLTDHSALIVEIDI